MVGWDVLKVAGSSPRERGKQAATSKAEQATRLIPA